MWAKGKGGINMPATEVIVAPDREIVSLFDFSQADTLLFDDMSIGIKVEDAALMLGLVKTEFKNGKEYKTIRMDRINKYSTEYGFDHKWSKTDYMPEDFFYWLMFKVENEKSIEFRKRFSSNLRQLRIQTYLDQAEDLNSKDLLLLEENFKQTEFVLNKVMSKATSVTVRKIAKIISSEGRTVSERGLKELLKVWNWLLSDGKEPSQYALEKGLIEYKFNKTKQPTVFITQKGQMKILRKIFRPHMGEK